MKTYQIEVDDKKNFVKKLEDLNIELSKTNHGSVVFYMNWVGVKDEEIISISESIEEAFPEAVLYGNEASGIIFEGSLKYGVSATCYIFEDENSTAELAWVEDGTEFSNLEELWEFCNTKTGLRAVELIPSMSCVTSMKIDSDIPNLNEEIAIFGGASVSSDDRKFDSKVFAKGHSITENGVAVVLYFGENLHISTDYVLGWKGLGRYMQITKSHDKIISEIESVPAVEIYEKYLGTKESDKDNLVFPLIVEEDGIEFIRTPQMFLPDKSMRMFANIAEGLSARIAYGDKNTILNSLYDKAVEIASFKPQILKAYSCTARKMFWGDDEVERETLPLEGIAPMGGFYTGGEILRIQKKVRVMNSTLVVIGFREGEAKEENVKSLEHFEKDDRSLISKITHFVEVVSNEQKEALNVANEEKLRNDIIHDIIHSGKWSFQINSDDEIVSANYSEDARRIVNTDAEESVLGWIDLIHPDDKKAAVAEFYDALYDHSGKTPYDVTYRMIDKNGEYNWFHSAGRVIRDSNGSGEFFGIHINISEQIEEQLKQQERLKEALVMADSANHAKTEFLFNMSHDIRTPMNAILGFTNMAIKHIEDRDKTLDCLYKTQQSGDLLLSLINNVLEVSRIEAGKAEIEEQAGDMYYSFIDIENTMRVMAESKDIDLSFEFGEVYDRYVLCDFNRCERVFVNIISNAVKYTNEGGYIKVRCEQIDSTPEGIAVYKYTFEDNGIGMSGEFQEHIFEQFSRESNVTKTGIQGTGLGMAVCKSYVELMGGTISCNSKLGEGTTITVTLPFKIQKTFSYVDPVTNEVVTNVRPEDARHIPRDMAGRRVLLTEDNELNREIAVEILEEKGLIVEEADDGTTAVKILEEKGPSYYDVILMDIQMPIMDGYKATRKIRQMYPNANIPIIALSANAFAEDKAASLEAGMDAHVAKPINTDELFAVMSKFV